MYHPERYRWRLPYCLPIRSEAGLRVRREIGRLTGMRKAALALIICLSIHAGSIYAVCKSEACKQATAWKNGYTAVVLDDNISRADYFAVLDAVKANNGVIAIEAERVLLGWIPITRAGKIRGVRGVSAVLYEAVQRPDVFVHRGDALAALSFFNRVRTGEFEDKIEAGLAVTGQPLTGDVAGENSVSHSGTQDQTDFIRRAGPGKSAKFPGSASPLSIPCCGFYPPWHNPQMRGRITVQLFTLDSNGPDADGLTTTNLYTWSNTDYGTSRDQVFSAYTFWVNQAANHSPAITLSFRVETEDPFNRNTRSFMPTPIHYEPIVHSISDDYKWMNDALAANGYGAASPITKDGVYYQNEAYNDAKQNDPVYGPFDGSYTLYIVYNPSPAPDHFTNGLGAYVAYLGGPSATVPWNSLGWGPYNIGRNVVHETGHIFWACDEYYNSVNQSGCNTCKYCTYNLGPRNQVDTPWITNGNCVHSTDGSPCDTMTACMMKGEDYVLCSHTMEQVGW